MKHFLRQACWGVVGLWLAGQAMAQTVPPPEPPARQTGPKVYTPTITPIGSPPASQPWTNPPTPQGRPQYSPPNPVVPASASAPAAPPTMPVPRPPTAQPPQLPPLQTPSVVVEKRGPETVNFGQPLVYEIVVRNTGPTAVFDVRVVDEVPAGVRYLGGEPVAEVAGNKLGWAIGVLEPNAERRVRIDLQPPGEGEMRSVATATFTTAVCASTRVVQPRLTVAMRCPETVTAGETVPFQILVSNPGSGSVTNLALRCKLPEGLQHPQGQLVEADMGGLAAGETRTVTLSTVAVAGGRLAPELIATGDGGLEAKTTAAVVVHEAALTVKRSGPARCYLKSEVNFELEVGNPGSAVASNPVLTETLPAGLDFVSATEGGQYDPATRAVTWRTPAIPAGAKKKFAYRVKAVAIGEQVDKAVIQADRNIIAKAETSFNVEGIAALMLEVVDLEDPIEVGGELTYEIRVVNQGSCPCTGITIQATIPDGLQPLNGTGPTNYRTQGSQFAFEPLAKLATKADAVYRIKVRGIHPGDYRFKVQMTCDQLRQPVYKEESSRVYKDG